jgi:hypothetical protein
MPRKVYIIILSLLPFFGSGAVFHGNSSVLAKGKWYKLAITRTGVHQVTFTDLKAMGIEPSTVDVAKIRLFGNGSGMLPEVNSAPRTDDLREIAIQVEDGGDGRLDTNDRILFYGEQSDKWTYEGLSRSFTHQRNLYSDSTYYFLNFDQVAGKRVEKKLAVSVTPNNFCSSFDGYALHDLDQQNLIRSGRDWYGEVFDNRRREWTFPFYFPNIDTLSTVRIKWNVAANAPVNSWFYLSQSSAVVDSLKIDYTLPQEFTRAGRSKARVTIVSHPIADQSITLSYRLPSANSKGWLNFLELNCRQKLVSGGPQMSFRDMNTVGQGNITEFSVHDASAFVQIWDVTNPNMIKAMKTNLSNGVLSFTQTSDSLHEFIAFDGSVFYPVNVRGPVPNQNLHACEPTTLVIITDPLFSSQAEQLSEFHRNHNGISVQIVPVGQVYNEFACGQNDPTSIRDFMKMLYDRGTTESRPKYLLLLGDGSYDPKNRIPGNNNLIPTFQSVESLNSTASYVTDDYFGIMADSGGQEANGKIEIGIGRFPVSKASEAQAMVDKIISYSETDVHGSNDWRNSITFVADDEDQNLHFHQAEELCKLVAGKYPVFNVQKIYFDAYQLVKIPGGDRFPDANAALNDVVAKGSLIVNYTGHGGEAGWSYEQVLTNADILSWKNRFKLPVFVTATCEFSRFDNPERFTAGEMLILQPKGGAVALYSTTRLAFAGSNILLNISFFNHLMDKDTEGKNLKMGDLIRLSKNDNSNNFQLRNFVLLGDPAQSIAFPVYQVKTNSVNDLPANQPDTVKGMSTVTLTGQVENGDGLIAVDFNGVVNCKVYDKPVTNSTLGNRPDGVTYPENFKIQNSLLFQGDVPVEAGKFNCSFVLPKNISLQYGKGKISYYATSENAEAAGYTDQVVIGGHDDLINPVNQGPEIGLYFDDRNFVSGGKIGEAAILLVDLCDTNGINSLGLGIGHEIEAVLDNDRAKAFVLNDYYAPAFNSYTRGTVTYPLDGLSHGFHVLSIRAWDMFDNSTLKEISFYVSYHSGLTVTNVMNVPNPLVDHTSFIFQPQQLSGGGLDVQIAIYNLHGMLVRILDQSFPDPAGAQLELLWDGTDSNGRKLSNGLYPYKIVFKSANGAYSETSQKLMITR